MRAIGLMRFGGPEVLRPINIQLPEPGPGEVRIRVHAAAVNPTDAIFRAGNGQARLLGDRPPPFVPGMDAAGIIDKIGPNNDGRLAVGDPVIALVLPAGPRGGAYADELVTLGRVPGRGSDGGLAEVRGWAGPSERNIAVHTLVANSVAGDTRRLEQVCAVAELGRLTLRIAEVLPSERAADAHRRLDRGGLRGRLVLDFTQ